MTTVSAHAVVDRAIERIHAEDTEGFLDLFTEDGHVDDWGRILRGRDEIRAWSDNELIGAHGRMTDIVETHTDDTATINAMWTSEHHTGRSAFEFHVDGDRITAMKITAG